MCKLFNLLKRAKGFNSFARSWLFLKDFCMPGRGSRKHEKGLRTYLIDSRQIGRMEGRSRAWSREFHFICTRLSHIRLGLARTCQDMVIILITIHLPNCRMQSIWRCKLFARPQEKSPKRISMPRCQRTSVVIENCTILLLTPGGWQPGSTHTPSKCIDF